MKDKSVLIFHIIKKYTIVTVFDVIFPRKFLVPVHLIRMSSCAIMSVFCLISITFFIS